MTLRRQRPDALRVASARRDLVVAHVCGVRPFREYHLQPLGKCIYLFLSPSSDVAGRLLTFAEGSVYKAYDIEYRLWASASHRPATRGRDHEDRRIAVPLGDRIFIFFKRVASSYKHEHDSAAPPRPPKPRPWHRPGQRPGQRPAGDTVTLTTRRRRAGVRRPRPPPPVGDEPTAR